MHIRHPQGVRILKKAKTRRKCPSRTCSGNVSNFSFEISFKEVNDSQSAA